MMLIIMDRWRHFIKINNDDFELLYNEIFNVPPQSKVYNQEYNNQLMRIVKKIEHWAKRTLEK